VRPKPKAWQRELEQAVKESRDAPSVDSIHDLRVAARHLRAYCRLAGEPDLDHELRWLVHQTGELRDLDVALAEPISRDAVKRLEEAHAVAARRVRKTLAKKRVRRMVRAAAGLKKLRRARSRAELERLHEKMLERTHAVESVAGVHALRRSLRVLQYCYEWLDLDAAEITAIQKRLGHVVDAAMRLTHAERLGDGGVALLGQRVEQGICHARQVAAIASHRLETPPTRADTKR
jgi:CHAD domain-containing protein